MRLRLNYFLAFTFLLCIHLSGQQSLIRFTENKGQWDDFIQYRAQLDGGALYAQKDALVYSFYDKETYRSMHGNARAKPTTVIKKTGFKVDFVNASPSVIVEASRPASDYNNYFLGNDASKWASHVLNYQRLLYSGLWQGIDMEAIGQDNSVKYNFYVKAGAEPTDIQLLYEKTEKISLRKGNLEIKTILGEITEHEPYAYQFINGIKTDVPCEFRLKNNTVSFYLPKGYDKNFELVIDPVLVFACSSGSTADNFGMTATYDNQGNLYSGGTCFDQGFPTVNPYDGTFNGVVQYGMTDVVITKYDSSGTYLHYSTYIGGANSSEIVTSLIIDSQNNLYLYGATGSNDFPMTAQAFDNTYNGGDSLFFLFNGTYFYYGTDIYVAKLSAGGNQLLASTYMGGSRNDGVNTNNKIAPYNSMYGTITGEYPPDSLQYNYGDQYRGEIQLDMNDNPVICSSSRSTNFPTKNAIDNTLGGWQDAVVFKFNPTLSQLQWSTYLGGSNNDAGYALFISQNNEVYATGGTRSTDFPATSGAYHSSYQGGKCDGYIAKISKNGTNLMAATYIGTNNYDQSYFIQLDSKQNAYVYGQSLGNMPVSNVSYSNANGKQFISKLDSSLSGLVYSTVIGNGVAKINLSPAAFLIDCSENIYISGWGGNIILGPPTYNMPLTSNAYQSSNPDGYNFYLMVLSKNAQQLLYATYFGGPQSHEHVDGGTSRFDKKGIIYQSVCAGCGGNSDFPVTPGSWPTPVYGNHWNQSSNCNNGTFKFNFEYNSPKAVIKENYSSGCAPLTVQFTNNSLSYNQYVWNFGNGDTSSTVLNPVKTYTAAGTYTATLLVKSDCALGFDTTRTIITVFPTPVISFSAIPDSCRNSVTYINTTTVSTGSITYNWSFGNGQTSSAQNPGTINYQPGTYTTTLIAISGSSSCSDTVKKTLHFTLNPMQAFPDTAFCEGKSVQLHASGGISYNWTPAASLSSTSTANTIASPTVTTIYTVTIVQIDGAGRTCNFIFTNTITIYPKVTSLFSFVYDSCKNSATFQNNSTVPPGSVNYSWSFGNGTGSSSQNPGSISYAAGNYTASLLVTSAFGCSNASSQPLHFTLKPMQALPDTAFCYGRSVQLHAGGGTSYTWSPATGLSNTAINNPVASPTASTIYTVTITQTDAAGRICNFNLTDTVIIHPKVTAAFNYTKNNCGNTLTFQDSSYQNVTSWQWNFGDSLTDNIQNPVHSYMDPGNYTITLVANNQYNCPDSVKKAVSLSGFSPIKISKSTYDCKGNPVQLNASGGLSYTWAPAGNLSDAHIPNPIATPTSTTHYTLYLTQVSNSGDTCYSVLKTNIIVPAYSNSVLTTYASPDTIYVGQSSQLGAYVNGGNIVWSPDYNLSEDTSLNPLASPHHTTTYSAVYIDPHGCRFPLSSVTVYVIASECDESTVYVPNTFTPNGDGRNDVLYARSNLITEIYFTVYDRWGEKVFETTDITKGWDGIFNGKPANPDVFGYYVKFKCNNGKESFKKGNVTLIR